MLYYSVLTYSIPLYYIILWRASLWRTRQGGCRALRQRDALLHATVTIAVVHYTTHTLYYAMLCHTILHYTMLCYTIIYYTILYYIYYTILYADTIQLSSERVLTRRMKVGDPYLLRLFVAFVAHMLPHVAVCCRVLPTLSRESLSGGIAAFLRRLRLS